MPLLNAATAVYLGATPAQAVYLGATQVWQATAAPPSGPFSVTHLHSAENIGSNLPSYTFQVDLGAEQADRDVIVVWGIRAGNPQIGVTVNGVALTALTEYTATTDLRMWSGNVPTGGVVDVVLTSTGSAYSNVYSQAQVYKVTGDWGLGETLTSDVSGSTTPQPLAAQAGSHVLVQAYSLEPNGVSNIETEFPSPWAWRFYRTSQPVWYYGDRPADAGGSTLIPIYHYSSGNADRHVTQAIEIRPAAPSGPPVLEWTWTGSNNVDKNIPVGESTYGSNTHGTFLFANNIDLNGLNVKDQNWPNGNPIPDGPATYLINGIPSEIKRSDQPDDGTWAGTSSWYFKSGSFGSTVIDQIEADGFMRISYPA